MKGPGSARNPVDIHGKLLTGIEQSKTYESAVKDVFRCSLEGKCIYLFVSLCSSEKLFGVGGECRDLKWRFYGSALLDFTSTMKKLVQSHCDCI